MCSAENIKVREISANNALHAYKNTLRCFQSIHERHNHNYEAQDLFLRIPYNADTTVDLRNFLERVFESEPVTLTRGLKKAERAYVRKGDRITKPSYISRIRAYPDYSKRTKLVSEIDQIRSVAKVFCEEPNASYHVISIFRPIDLLEKFRPGYVPCVICADFKYRDKKLNAKFFFRSCDAYNLLPFDLFYSISIAEELLHQIVMNGFDPDIEIGEMIYWFSRIYISRFDVDRRETMLRRIEAYHDQHRRSSQRNKRILKEIGGKAPVSIR